VVTVVLLAAFAASAQPGPDWRKIGAPAVELRLASAATGPVERVWFSPGGSVLYARTRSGQTFETADFESWSATAEPADLPVPLAATAARLPETGARVETFALNLSRIYALGANLWRSDDGGRSWENLTGYKSDPVVGAWQHSLAISAADPEQLILANDYGVWRSLDGGLSWSGLNLGLPNLAIRRILSTPSSVGGIRVLADAFGALELPPGGTVWLPSAAPRLQTEDAAKSQYSAALGAAITAFATSGQTVYAGSNDGRIWVSVDGGSSFASTQVPAGTAGRVERIWADPARPATALAALGGSGPHLLRTTNGGVFWDSLDGNLAAVPVRAVTADHASGTVYVATDKGVFFGQADLQNASVPAVAWSSLTSRLPAAPATDVALDPAGFQLYIALDGYGVYAAAAPHRTRNLRIVNAADFSARAAAPGSLLTVIGGRVSSARGGNLEYPVLAVLDAESQIQVPFEAVGPSVALALQTPAGPVRRDVPVQPVSPAIFVGRDGGPWIYDADSGQLLDSRNAAHSNGRIQIMATGLGKVRPDWPTGIAAPLESPPAVAAAVRVYLDGAPLQVTRATLAPGYVGFYLIEAQLPAANAGTSELYLSAEGQDSNKVQVYIEP
jgi:uncharacterized protein (TIGR03437 family)